MAIQVNIFEAGSVPTAQELAALINELNTTLDESVTLTGEQSITGVKTFLGSKLIKFKQSTSADKLGFTLYDYQSKEVGNFEYDNKSNFRLLALGNYVSAANQEVECNIGFKIYNKLQGAAYRLLCPLAGNAKNSIPSLTDTYTNFYMPLVFTNGALSVTTDNNGKVDLSTLIGSGGSGDTSNLATVATTGDYNDLLNKPILFSGNYNDLTNKPTLFSGSYGDLTDKPTLFSGDYNDLTNKPTIPVVDITKAQADGWYQPKGDYALATDLFSGSYNDLTDKPSLFSGSYNDLADKPTIPTVPTISTNITSDATSDTKTASPKAVKDFVEGKGYLTQHQDISGKADQVDLEALEDRVDALEQSSSGDTTQHSYLELIDDLDAYTDAPAGKIVKYNGQTNNKYTRGWDYECVIDSSDDVITIPVGTKSCYLYNSAIENLDIDRQFYAIGTEQFNYAYNLSTGRVYWKQNAVVGDYVLWTSVSTSSDYKFCRIIEILSNGVKYEYPTTSGYTTATLHSSSPLTYNKLINADGIILYYWNNDISTGLKNNVKIVDWDNQKSYYPTSVQVSQTTEDITIGTQTISWQPIIMPSSNNIQTDVELSSSSHYPVENATLYDELRVEEAGSVLSVNSTNYPIVELDATDFDSIVYTGAGDTDFTFKVIPTLDSNKAYIIKNANFEESVNYYSFSNQGTFIVKFQSTGSLSEWTSIGIGHNVPDNYNYYQTEGTEFNEWLSIPATYQFNVTDWGGYDNDTTIPYYGTPYEDGGSSTITELTNATETTSSTSVIKSLKAKVMELEAQIAQISAQLQNIASN